jgi:hypothetical protein
LRFFCWAALAGLPEREVGVPGDVFRARIHRHAALMMIAQSSDQMMQLACRISCAPAPTIMPNRMMPRMSMVATLVHRVGTRPAQSTPRWVATG